MRINQNEMARVVAENEGKKVQVSIAQIKEVQRCTFEYLVENHCAREVLDLLVKISERLGVKDFPV